MYRVLRNKGNDCWLNTLVQCFNALPLQRLLTAVERCNVPPVVSILIDSLRKLDENKEQPLHLGELHKAFHSQFHYIPGAQNNIHESFTNLCSGGGRYDDVVGSHFQGAIRYIKTCTECNKIVNCNPEPFTTIFVPLANDIIDIGESIEDSLNEDSIAAFCDRCDKRMNHNRKGCFVFLPETLVIAFKRFEMCDGYSDKKHMNASLSCDLQMLINEHFHDYRLTSCALHYGTQIQTGHYTALVCKNNNVTELDDTVTKDVSRNWQQYSAKTVYLAFYCKKANSVNDVSTDNRKCSEVDPQKTSKKK